MTMDEMVKLCKEYGYIFQGSEIYGGLANTWDYGPLGCKLKNNLKNTWRKRFITAKINAYEIDASILMHPKVWVASGHLANFSDPLIDCKECKIRVRADNLVDEYSSDAHADGMTVEELNKYIKEQKIPCPHCGKSNFTEIREFNLMFETKRGVVKDSSSIVYLRPENAQGEYVNYLNVKRTTRSNLPFAIGQIGKAFRNEITPGNFTFRTIEFEQMEYQIFCKPGTDSDIYEEYKEYAKKYFMDLGIPDEKLRYHNHEKLAHYAKEACDIDYLFPFGWGEINGTHNRTDYDLTKHQEYSKTSMEFVDSETSEKYIPYIIESTVGIDRLTLAILFNSYRKETLEDSSTREYMDFIPFIAPYKVSILPLIKKKHSEKAMELFKELSNCFDVSYDASGTIGKRYHRQDMMGTPYSITVDDQTLENNIVTVRDRNTTKQISLNIEDIKMFLDEKIVFKTNE